MAPEILYGKAYDGASVDLFAATIILFIMYSGAPPFNNPLPSDMYYKLLMQNKKEFFWRIHSKMTLNFYSEDFRDLIERMLSFNPEERMKIDELQKHPWMRGETPSSDDIKKLFTTKQKRIQEDSRIDIEGKIAKYQEVIAMSGDEAHAFRVVDKHLLEKKEF